jgi:orotate phosphoribosyltransferase
MYKQKLIEVIKDRSVKHGNFKLTSGKKSDIYIDGKQTTLSAQGSYLIAKMILEHLDPKVVAVGGMSIGADPIAGAVASMSWSPESSNEFPVQGFIVRKEVKKHGTVQHVEGMDNLQKGDAVCILEDTCTSGRSALSAISKAENAGLKVIQVITVVDRQEGAKERIEKAGYPFKALVLKEDLSKEIDNDRSRAD